MNLLNDMMTIVTIMILERSKRNVNAGYHSTVRSTARRALYIHAILDYPDMLNS